MRCSCCQEELVSNLTLRELFFSSNRRCYYCEKLFSKIDQETACPGCGRSNSLELCQDCYLWEQKLGFVMNNISLFHYDEGFRQWIERYKFIGDYRLRGAFLVELTQTLQLFRGYLICPLPLSKERFEQRGFNQVCGCLDLTRCSYEALLKRVELTPQSEKSREERLQMTQPFELKVSKEKIRNQRVLLVDDVYTTGRTLFHAAELLYKNGAETVKSLTFAR
ncbi:ComF family protein [Enterococcus raffinosus]|uniref:ComF family protein n=1 Tax=Enterococcus raffinosus TaxID=71452 RepID=A0AAW8TAR9_9ENTE|nr:ComF family protein [Enterococcus raffinosus]MDT2525317.1 ComF family protein [Enterococcus raffinosus]MDT2531548.1 ComF family protein [Enterococcus raffinosus]MDT2535853.1 ComF family protein [Enterococcus raffinosus]MDT2546421.1 ComF family protein [Enterococcus raffinosus]MDT2556223.1 ComF family protein [Enterococcus raffinosus]